VKHDTVFFALNSRTSVLDARSLDTLLKYSPVLSYLAHRKLSLCCENQQEGYRCLVLARFYILMRYPVGGLNG